MGYDWAASRFYGVHNISSAWVFHPHGKPSGHGQALRFAHARSIRYNLPNLNRTLFVLELGLSLIGLPSGMVHGVSKLCVLFI